MTRRQSKLARRAALNGSGPVPHETAPPRWPGAVSTFALLGEVLLTGILVTAGSLLVVTFPAALAAGIRHLRRFLEGKDSRAGSFWRELLAALPGGLAVGGAALVPAVVLLLNIRLASTGALPGGSLVGPASWGVLAFLVLFTAAMAAQWTPDAGWRPTLRLSLRALTSDPGGALYVFAAVVFAGIVTWQLVPLIVPALGCVVLAVVAAPERRRRGGEDGSTD